MDEESPTNIFQILLFLDHTYSGYIQYTPEQGFSNNWFRLSQVDGYDQLPKLLARLAFRNSSMRVSCHNANNTHHFCRIRSLILHPRNP
jgi:hypothetical protein